MRMDHARGGDRAEIARLFAGRQGAEGEPRRLAAAEGVERLLGGGGVDDLEAGLFQRPGG